MKNTGDKPVVKKSLTSEAKPIYQKSKSMQQAKKEFDENKEDAIFILRQKLERLCKNYDKSLNFEYQADDFLSELDQALSVKEQFIEHLLEKEREIVMDMTSGGMEDCEDCMNVFNYLDKLSTKPKENNET